jgi:ANTAR domain-containing protein/GAF domain-containing protein
VTPEAGYDWDIRRCEPAASRPRRYTLNLATRRLPSGGTSSVIAVGRPLVPKRNRAASATFYDVVAVMARSSPVQLAAVFADLERELTALSDAGSVLRLLTSRAVELVPGAEHAGITRGRDGRFETVAATDALVGAVDAIQYELRSGPCVDAILESTVFSAPDLRTDHRWPEFGARAADLGVLSMLSFRLFTENNPDLNAGLNLYATGPSAFDETSESVGMLFATHGALAVAGAAAQEKADNLVIALQNSREIGVAMGVLMTRHQTTREEAFNLLRIASQRMHRKLADVAAEVADTGTLPAPADRRSRPA